VTFAYASPPNRGDSVEELAEKLITCAHWIERHIALKVYFGTCVCCGKAFTSKPKQKQKKTCSEVCRRANKAALYKKWAQGDGAKKSRRAYDNKYYADNKDVINKKQAEKLKNDPIFAERCRERSKKWYLDNASRRTYIDGRRTYINSE
jgi:hypothetical protein